MVAWVVPTGINVDPWRELLCRPQEIDSFNQADATVGYNTASIFTHQISN